MSPRSWGVEQGLQRWAETWCCAYICAGHALREIQTEEFIPEGGTVRCAAIGASGDLKDLVWARPIERKFGLKHLRICAGLRASANSRGRTIQPSPIIHHEVGNLAQSVRTG